MTPKEYTDDAVCFAMGLGQLIPTIPGEVVRLVCRPSFHPEVCVTLTPKEIVAVALHSILWPEPVLARMPEVSERATLSAGEFESIRAAFDHALAESTRPPKWVVCDGMGVSAVRVRADRIERYSGHAVNEEEMHFVKSVLSLALLKSESVELRNRISWCGRYLYPRDDSAFPIAAEPSLPQPHVSRLLVMGTPEDRAEFHAIFGAKATTRRPT